LLCPSGAGAKFDKAVEWGTPVVGYDWLSEMAQTGLIPPSNMFLIGAGGVRLPPDVMPDFTPSTPSLSMKGKGRDSLTPAGGIQDITNGKITDFIKV
jgi:DNA replication regulator DPB11